jgi:integrase
MTSSRARRANGDGSIYPDVNRPGAYIGLIYVDGRRRKVRGRTKTDIRAKFAALQRERDEGVTSDGNVTVANVLDLWRDRTLANRDLAPATRSGYEDNLAVLRREFGSQRLRQLDVARVERGLDRIATGMHGRGKPLSRSTMTHLRSTLAQALDVALRRRWIAHNPARLAELTPSAPPTDARQSLTTAEAERLWDALDGERLGNYFRLLLTLGLRPGEGLGLCWDAVDLDAGILHVWRAVRRDRGRAELVDYVKTAKSYRTIGLPEPAVEVLRAQRRVVAELKLAARTWVSDDRQLVFPNPNGGPWDPSNARDELARTCEEAGLWRVRPYELRHSAASILSDRGVALEEIADLLGHVDTTMLSRVYRHRIRPSADAAVDVMGSLFSATPKATKRAGGKRR